MRTSTIDDLSGFSIFEIFGVQLSRSIIIQTRKGWSIPNEQPEEIDDYHRNKADGHVMSAFGLIAPPRRRIASATYNCHGMTFACRRTGIYSNADVQRILLDDGYREIINKSEVMPGDVALYFEPRGIDSAGIHRSPCLAHSAVVCDVIPLGETRTIKVLSKWGSAGEYVHELRNGPYEQATLIRIYREGDR